MKYFVKIGEQELELVLDGGTVRVGDDEVTAHLAEMDGSPVRLLTIGDRVHRVAVRRGAEKGQYSLSIDGWRFDADALDERSRAIRALSAAAAGPKGPAPLVAPMPGLIVRVNVQMGDRVQAGDPLFEILPDPTPLELTEARREVEIARNIFDQAKKKSDRASTLRQQGIMSSQESDIADKEIQDAQIRLNLANEKLALIDAG